MMKIGIIGAMEEEVAGLKDKSTDLKVKQIAGSYFHEGTLENKKIVIVQCGIGKVNAAVCTQALIDNFDINYVINTGVAGGVYEELDIGDIVISKDAVQHDFDTTAFGDGLGVIPRMGESFFKADEKLIDLAKTCIHFLNPRPNVFIGRIASGDQFISSLEEKQRIWDKTTSYQDVVLFKGLLFDDRLKIITGGLYF